MRKSSLCTTLVILTFSRPCSANFEQCLATINTMTIDGKTDNHGHPLPSTTSNATAITYDLCVSQCGAGQEPFQWSVFSQQFSSWLLPWLALVSQLPFGANDKLDNLESVLLTVGSPTLATYSLSLTLLNGRWIAQLFSKHHYPNAQKAMRILSSLQQSPLRVITEDALLASLVVLPQNDEWWSELLVWLDYTYTWSIAAAASIAWVIIAYVFTLLDYFSQSLPTALNANGQGVGSIGSLWLWLLCIVVGWLQISPKCDSIRLEQAFARTNSLAYVATTYSEPCKAHLVTEKRAISIDLAESDEARKDERSTPPIFNYARYLAWVEAVMIVSYAFERASDRMVRHEAVVPGSDWKERDLDEVTRKATLQDVQEYCSPRPSNDTPLVSRRALDHSALSRMLIASVVALVLQWATTGSAIIIVWFTPTVGCRSASFIAYGVLSTLIWLMLLTSSILTYHSTKSPVRIVKGHTIRPISSRLARCISIFLRRTGKFLALLNSIWIVAVGLLQFGSFYDRCYCNSSVFGLGKEAYNVIIPTQGDIASMRSSWIGGFCLAGGFAVCFIVFVNLYLDRPTSS
ncbi:hypothetical protein CVT26_004055 [Gymnopilus dilepis]|uniref:Uncharacterized protein n=1 Tax=Gymnopilus dilepis TaxID=231916 RepID=A0A409YMN6_9AGAR|nr:hypothetical protein CVT26_004055 [Gymnopilus dilepis]